MTDEVDISEAARCTAMRLRRTTRQVTQHYDHVLQDAKLTVTQFTILVFLYNRHARAIGRLARGVGTDPTTLNRNLQPLIKRRLVRSKPDPEDRRTHMVFITNAGRARVEEALPLWRRAQDELTEMCGIDTTMKLNELLDLSYDKLRG